MEKIRVCHHVGQWKLTADKSLTERLMVQLVELECHWQPTQLRRRPYLSLCTAYGFVMDISNPRTVVAALDLDTPIFGFFALAALFARPLRLSLHNRCGDAPEGTSELVYDSAGASCLWSIYMSNSRNKLRLFRSSPAILSSGLDAIRDNPDPIAHALLFQ